jgi:exodeoxyribonuclease V beta subunit
MTSEHKVFDVASSPLHRAVHLIEASAGTGKTYAIAMLVLRFITEFSLKIEDILLVTFTRAATEELGERIRRRLVEGRQLLEGSVEEADATLLSWAEAIDDHEQSLVKIKTALLDIDRAQIFTIHGFCQRMLQEQALESSQLFDVELQPDNDTIEQRVIQDFWRTSIYSMPKRQCGVIVAHFSTPEQLHKSVSPLSRSITAIEPETAELQAISQKFEEDFQELRSWWLANSEILHDTLAEVVAEGKMKKKFSENFPSWWHAITAYFQQESYYFPDGLQYLSSHEFAGEINGNKVRGAKKTAMLESIVLPDHLVNLLLDDVRDLLLSLRRTYALYYLEEIERQMIDNNIMSYDDLILRLHRALTGSSAKHLLTLLRHRFQAAVIDEFQDTDSLQWQIFSTIFTGGQHFLYLIGDPKQAIYKFRGADIHSYFLAKQSAEKTLTLEKNYRSHPECVSAVNSLFSSRTQPFFYEESMLDFSPVKAALSAKDNLLEREQASLENMVFCQLPKSSGSKDGSWTSAKAAELIMQDVTSEIVTLLQGNIRYTYPIDNVVKQRELQPKDIAILVRQNDHAEQYQAMLAQAGVAAVLASRNSVFQTTECDELYVVLNSLADPDDIVLLKRAMTVSWFGLSGVELYGIWQDDTAFNRYYSRFQGYAETWQNQGVLYMMKRFLEVENVFVTLAAGERAERKISNIQHLIELLQHAEDENVYGSAQLLQWLRRNMKSPTGEYELRLDSDDDAVRIVTMHGAKGLEYPVVFCPSLWYRRTGQEKENQRVTSHEDGQFILDLGSSNFDTRHQHALQEDMAEDLRLCYVALTRAKMRCYVMWCDYKGRKGSSADSFLSGIGYLLFPQGRVAFEVQQQVLSEKGLEHGSAHRMINTEIEKVYLPSSASTGNSGFHLRERHRGSLYAERQMTSYSALVAAGQHTETYDDELTVTPEPIAIAPDVTQETTPFAVLPSGANFGNVVHDIFESIPFAILHSPEQKRQEIEQICRKYGVEADIELLMKLLQQVVTAPLVNHDMVGKEGFNLASIEPEKCVKEMGFYYNLRSGTTMDINRLLAAEKTVRPLHEKKIAGFLTGFVDLIFQHNNMYYIADYKTNNLGEKVEDYSPDNLIAAMADHNYGLQYFLYSLVLHRYLQNFMKGYDYSSHFGGVLYLFVRGMDKAGRGIYYHKPELQILENLGKCFEGS